MSRLYGKPFYKLYRIRQEPDDYFYIKNESGSDGSVDINYMNNVPSSQPQYSLDGITWTTFTDYSSQISVPTGGKILFRSTTGWNEYDKAWNISPSMNVSIGGNLATLINWMEKDSITIIPDYCFAYLIPANGSYFIDASQLTTGNLTTAGYCSFLSAFAWTNINTLGDFSSLTTIGENAFQSTFLGCENLTTGIDLSNVTSVNNYSLWYMYQQCYNLEDVTAPNVSEWDEQATSSWLSSAGTSVVGTKTAHVPDNVTIPENISGIPSGWTRVTY